MSERRYAADRTDIKDDGCIGDHMGMAYQNRIELVEASALDAYKLSYSRMEAEMNAALGENGKLRERVKQLEDALADSTSLHSLAVEIRNGIVKRRRKKP